MSQMLSVPTADVSHNPQPSCWNWSLYELSRPVEEWQMEKAVSLSKWSQQNSALELLEPQAIPGNAGTSVKVVVSLLLSGVYGMTCPTVTVWWERWSVSFD